jgi:hypothetical protein
MAEVSQYTEADLYRVILFASRGAKLLVLPQKGKLRLPTCRVPKQQRIAEHLTAAVQSRWSPQAVCLFRLDSGSCPSGLHYHVMEACEEDPCRAAGANWVSFASLDASGCQRGPFGRLGWFSELTAWTQDALRSEGLVPSGRFTQLNASPTFSLVRLAAGRFHATNRHQKASDHGIDAHGAASSRLSVNNWRTSRSRLPPSANLPIPDPHRDSRLLHS